MARVKNTERIFGGFTSVPWTSTFSFHADNAAFLFCNRNNTEQFDVKITPNGDARNAVCHVPKAGPAFGGGGIGSQMYGFDAFFLADGDDVDDVGWCEASPMYSCPGYNNDTLVGPYGWHEGDSLQVSFQTDEVEMFVLGDEGEECDNGD